jgi:hypothetical protein
VSTGNEASTQQPVPQDQCRRDPPIHTNLQVLTLLTLFFQIPRSKTRPPSARAVLSRMLPVRLALVRRASKRGDTFTVAIRFRTIQRTASKMSRLPAAYIKQESGGGDTVKGRSVWWGGVVGGYFFCKDVSLVLLL